MKNDSLQDVPKQRNNSRSCKFKSINCILTYLQNCCIVAKNKTLQGLRYAKIKFIEYAGNISLGFL